MSQHIPICREMMYHFILESQLKHSQTINVSTDYFALHIFQLANCLLVLVSGDQSRKHRLSPDFHLSNRLLLPVPQCLSHVMWLYATNHFTLFFFVTIQPSLNCFLCYIVQPIISQCLRLNYTCPAVFVTYKISIMYKHTLCDNINT